MARTFAGGDISSTPSDLRTSELPEHDHGYDMADEIDRRNGWSEVQESTQGAGVDALGMFLRWLVDQERLSLKQTALRALVAVHSLRPDLLGGRTKTQVAELMGADRKTFSRAEKSLHELIAKR